MTDEVEDLVIAGSGIAGLSAAVYAARADLDPLVFEGDEPGGQLTLTTDVENFLGFPEGVGGMELIQRGREQAEQFGAEFEHGRIVSAATDSQPIELELSTGDTVRTRTLVVATGASAREHDDVEFRWNTELQTIHGSQEDGVTGATLVSHPDGYPREKATAGLDVETETVDVGGVFYGVGHTPNTAFLNGTDVERDEDGYIVPQPDDAGRLTTETRVDGVFAAGDVADPAYRQAITSAGTGSMAALDAEAYLDSLEAASELTVNPTA